MRISFYVLGALFELSGILLVASPDLVPGAIGAAGRIRRRWPGLVRSARKALRLKPRPVHEVRYAHDISETHDSASAVVRTGAKSLEDAVTFLLRRDQEAQHVINGLADRVASLEVTVEREIASLRDFVEGRVSERVAAAQADFRTARLIGVVSLLSGLLLTTWANFLHSTTVYSLRPVSIGDVPTWLTAVGGLGVFLATYYLARTAVGQMEKAGEQADSARQQVKVMRDAAARDAAAMSEQIAASRQQVEVIRDAAETQAVALSEQIAASIAQSDAIKDAARVMIQPRVIGQITGPVVGGPRAEWSIGPEEMAFQYRLVNEGAGVALNIRHGITVGGVEHAFGGGMEMAALAPGLAAPPFDDQFGGHRPLVVAVERSELPEGWEVDGYEVWARFGNALGERYETRNPSDPQRSSTFGPDTDS